MKKRILVDVDTVAFLRKAFNVSRATVWRALTFETNTDLAKRIRKLALERGGRLTDGRPAICDTTHNQTEKTMTQTFGNRARIVADLKTGDVTVWIDGEQESTYHNLTIHEFINLLKEFETRAMNL